MLITALGSMKRTFNLCRSCRIRIGDLQKCYYSQELENVYSDIQKKKILEVMNSDVDILSRYNITKAKLKKCSIWKNTHGKFKTLSDIELIDGFTDKYAKKLYNSILEPTTKPTSGFKTIKGQILHPTLDEVTRKNCKSVLAVYVTVNSVSWSLIERANYELLDWEYHSIDYTEGKRMQITDIFKIAYRVSQLLPHADIYVMKAEPTTLRAAGSDPNNPKVIAVNLQKAQMIAMLVALINNRNNSDTLNEDPSNENEVKHKVYFLRHTLPFRLYGTLVGNERVSTDQTIEMLLQNDQENTDKTRVNIPAPLKSMFRSQKDLQKDMLGHCLLLCLTFMDICIYRNQESVNKLIKRDN